MSGVEVADGPIPELVFVCGAFLVDPTFQVVEPVQLLPEELYVFLRDEEFVLEGEPIVLERPDEVANGSVDVRATVLFGDLVSDCPV